MDTKIFYLYIIVIGCLIQFCCSEKKQPFIEIVNVDGSINGKSLEEAVNQAFDELTNQLFNKDSKDSKSVSDSPVLPTTTKVPAETLENNKEDEDNAEDNETYSNNLLDNTQLDDEDDDQEEEEEEEKENTKTTTVAPPPPSSVPKTTQVVTKTTTVVVPTSPPRTRTTQVVQPTKAPSPPQSSSNNGSSSSNSKPVSNNNNSNSNSSSSSNNVDDTLYSNNAVAPNANVNNNVGAAQSAAAPQSAAEAAAAAEAPQPAEAAQAPPEVQAQPDTQAQPQTQPIVTGGNSDQKLKGNVDGQNKTNEPAKKSKFSTILKISLGIAAGGICIAGLLVGKNKFGKKSDGSLVSDSNYSIENLPGSGNDTYGRTIMNLKPTDSTDNPGEGYSQQIQPMNYLNPKVSNLPTDTLPKSDFINTNSIEPLPNLVNKVDVELPIYNIQEEKYNTVGRPLDDSEPINTWNEEEITDETQLINKEGYNNIVPEMGEMVIENNHRPSLYAALEELENEGGNNQNTPPNDNMRQIIPDIQYATVEVNNEFDNIDIDDDVLGNQPGNDNMKQIIPDIQYATVEVNNEFAGIDEDDSLNNSHSKVIVDIDAQRSSVASSDSDIRELRASQDFLAMPSNMTNFKNISDTYRNALRDTFDGGNRDTLSSTDSILHKLR